MNHPPPLAASVVSPKPARRWHAVLKLAAIAGLIVLLQVPLLLVWNTLREREQRRRAASEEIASTWGGDQVIVGPVLAVPYTLVKYVPAQRVVGERLVEVQEQHEENGTAFFLPASFTVEGALEPSVKYRGIFRTVVYAARVTLAGEFLPDTSALGLEGAEYAWARARVLLSVSDPRGFRAAPTWRRGESETAFVPGAWRENWPQVVEAPVALNGPDDARGAFQIELTLQGAGRLAVAPVGAENRATLRAAWTDPSFDGRYLPVAHEITSEGFSARWEMSYFGRGFPQQWKEQVALPGVQGFTMASSAFGVTLATPVDAYRLVERSLKYALLFLGLVFAVFFLFEVTAATRVHVVQYLMVGAALTLFYLGFLALGEFIPSGAAYGVAAAASTLLIAGYSWSVLRAGWRTAIVGLGLAATYGYLYFILQLQDYALLAGTGALFALLAVAMWVTRRLDWDQLGTASARSGAQS